MTNSNDWMDDAEYIARLTDFENYCGNCDNFKTDDCPFVEVVEENTKWKDINCKNFWD